MKTNKIYHKKLTLSREYLQLKFNLNTELDFEDDGKICLVQKLVERMDLQDLVKSYSKAGRKAAIDPVTMLEVLIYCYSEGIYSSRKIEKACKYDLRVRYLLEEQKAPDHATINRYRQRLEPFIKGILKQNTKMLIEDEHVDLSSIYIDGTKIEAYANRYTFVWKKFVLSSQERLISRILEHFDLSPSTEYDSLKEHLEKRLKSVLERAKGIEFVYGKGRRKSQIQRDYELYKTWLDKLNEYERHLEIMGERNSYSKTDHDATFMRMKEDHMRNGQLKPGYNIQLASSGQFIIGAYGSHHPSDMKTLPLFMDEIYPDFKEYLDKIVCDAGYESIGNYKYLKQKDLRAFIKPSNYNISRTRRFKQDLGKRENMIYDEINDNYICANSKRLIRQKDEIEVGRCGFEELLHVYKCFECKDCPYQKQCNKYSKHPNPETKRLKFNPEFNALRQESYENIMSEEGMNERLNRSIQAEGMFSMIKEGLNYHRFRHRGLSGIMCDLSLLVLGINLNQLHRKLMRNQTKIIKYKKAS